MVRQKFGLDCLVNVSYQNVSNMTRSWIQDAEVDYVEHYVLPSDRPAGTN